MIRTLIFIITAVVLATSARAGSDLTTVALKPRSDAGAGATITIGDIAAIDGPLAGRIAPISVPAGSGRVDATAVRTVLRESGLNLGLIVVSGAPCRVAAAAPASTPRAAAPTPDAPTVNWAEGDTVRRRVIERLAAAFDVAEPDLNIGFDPSDAVLLNTPAGDGTVIVRPLGTADRMPLAIEIFQADRLIERATIRATVTVRREALVATRRLGRDDTLDASVCTAQSVWMAPSKRPVDPDLSRGWVIKSRVDAGQIIEENDLTAPIVVRKGDLVSVDCLSGTIRLKAMARALGSARDGEICAFRLPGSEKTFHARVNGPGRAVTVTTAHHESSTQSLAQERN